MIVNASLPLAIVYTGFNEAAIFASSNRTLLFYWCGAAPTLPAGCTHTLCCPLDLLRSVALSSKCGGGCTVAALWLHCV